MVKYSESVIFLSILIFSSNSYWYGQIFYQIGFVMIFHEVCVDFIICCLNKHPILKVWDFCVKTFLFLFLFIFLYVFIYINIIYLYLYLYLFLFLFLFLCHFLILILILILIFNFNFLVRKMLLIFSKYIIHMSLYLQGLFLQMIFESVVAVFVFRKKCYLLGS